MTVATVDEQKVDELFAFKKDGAPAYYPYQREAILEILKAYESGQTFVIADACTGSGKSVIAKTIADYFGEGCWATTPKNILVDQYASLGFRRMKGAANFRCPSFEGSCKKSTDYMKARGDLPKNAKGCKPECPYATAWRHFFDDKDPSGCITNQHFMWNAMSSFAKTEKGLLVVDEAHLFEPALADMIRIHITSENLAEVGYSEPLAGASRSEWLEGYEAQIKSRTGAIANWLKSHGGDRRDPQVGEHLELQESLAKRLQALKYYSDFKTETRWVTTEDLDDDGFVEKLVIEPVYGGFLATRMFSLAKRVLLMSATMLDPARAAHELHIPEKNLAYVKIPSYFPAENQPMYWDREFSLNYGNLDNLLPDLVAKMDRIMDHHRPERGLIHSVSHKLTNAILRLTRHRKRMNLVEDGEKQAAAITRHGRTPGSILIGPAFIEGLDLPGELGTFAIFPKVPFLPIRKDKKLKAREEDNPGYGNLTVVRNLVQGKGRLLRSAQDRAATYMLDGNLDLLLHDERTIELFPDLFLESLIETERPL